MRPAILNALLSTVAFVQALPNFVEAPIDAVDLIWEGKVNIDGPVITLEGNAKTIHDQIIALNPNYDDELGVNSKEHLKKRQVNYKSLDCDFGNIANGPDLIVAYNYLFGLRPGLCRAPPGRPGLGNPGCSRTSCVNRTAIWLCNDVDRELAIPCEDVAAYALTIHNRCRRNDDVRGLAFSHDNWNVIVAGDNC